MTALDHLMSSALSLPEGDRAELANRLLESLEVHDPDWEAAWIHEAERRLAEMRKDPSRAIPYEDAMRSIRQSMRDARQD